MEPFPGRIDALTSDRGQLVAVGRDDDGLASWTSADGVTWQRHAVPNPTFGDAASDELGPGSGGSVAMGSMTRLGDTLFSFGTFWGDNDFYRPVAWRSLDGATWEFIQSSNAFYTYGTVTAAASMNDGLLAARSTGLHGAAYGMWNWTSESSWRPTDIESTAAAEISFLDVAVADGTALAVGERTEPSALPEDEWPRRVIGWRSAAGISWEEITMPDGLTRACGIAPSQAPGFVVIGKDGAGNLASWTTLDGSDWKRSDLAWSATLESCGAVALGGDWMVATATTLNEIRVWLSRDGLHWVLQDTPSTEFFGGTKISVLNGDVIVSVLAGIPDDAGSVLFHGRPME